MLVEYHTEARDIQRWVMGAICEVCWINCYHCFQTETALVTRVSGALILTLCLIVLAGAERCRHNCAWNHRLRLSVRASKPTSGCYKGMASWRNVWYLMLFQWVIPQITELLFHA